MKTGLNINNETPLDTSVDELGVLKLENLITGLSFNKDDILKDLRADTKPLEKFIALKKYSLAWIVEKTMRNDFGRPLRLLPFQCVLLDLLWHHKYPMILATRGAGKSFMYGVYALLRAILIPGSQICIVGAGFRQSKIVFSYIAKRYVASPIIAEALQSGGGPKYAVDQCSLKVGSSNIFAIPMGDGERIRGLRASNILLDEFGSIDENIFEIVVQPFAAVNLDPERNVRITTLLNKLIKYNAPQEIIDLVQNQLGFGNQICIGGTATYEFNHFYRKYEMYRNIIFSGGDKAIIARAFSEGNKNISVDKIDDTLMKAFKYTDYAIFQLPYTALPEGYLETSVVANAKLTYDPTKFGMEYLCKFAKDSDGFYKRSLIDEATPRSKELEVKIELFGEFGAQYVMGIDPARHNDYLAVSIIKLTKRGAELVYVWSIQGKAFDIVIEKIRELLRRFNIIYIAMDKGGGGSHLTDMLHKADYLKDGDVPIWDMNDDETRFMEGHRILDVFQWSNEWIREANYSMKGEIRNQLLLFPSRADENICYTQYMNWAHKKSLTEADKQIILEELYGEFSDDGAKTSLGVWDNIQETINEMCAIIVKVSEGGTEQFQLPSLSEQHRTTLTDARHRDRYSALLLASYAARNIRGTGHKKTDLPAKRSQTSTNNIKRLQGGTVYPLF